MPAAVRGYGGVHDTDTGIDPNSQPGIPSNITGTTPGGYDPAYGGVPLIPDPTASAWQAIGGDLNTLPQAFTLGNAYNLFNFGQQQQTLQGTPSYNSVLDLMGGKLPQDVINQIAQQAAERGVEGGHPNDPNANAAYLHALGLNSLQAQATGQQQYGALAGHYPMAAPFNLMDFLTTPEQQQAANTAANTNAAAPNPAEAARAEQAALLAAIAAGKGSVPPVGAAPGIPNLSGGISGGLSGPPPAQTMVGASTATGIPNPNGSTSRVPSAPDYSSIQQALNQFGPSANADPWTGAVNRGTNPANTNWWQNQDPYGALSGMDWGAPSPGGGSIPDQNAPAYSGGGSSGTNPASTNWWSSPDPWASLLGMDWSAPSDFGGGNGSELVGSGPDWGYTPGTPSSQSNWWESSDPWSALTGTDFTAPDMGGGEQIPDWAALPGEDYYGG
jgi:hypothetical protein